METDDIGALFGNLQRGHQLLALHRYAEAENHFRQALSKSPENADALLMLAAAVLAQPGRQKEALEIVNRAIAASPDRGDIHGLKALILSNMGRGRDALKAAKQAVSLDPGDANTFVALAQAHATLEEWRPAEEAARNALALDAECTEAANLLAHALRKQNRTVENADQIESMLRRNPDDADTHASAGWNYLQAGNRAEAERHFAEALRLDPHSEYARQGMLEAFRARSLVYRSYQQWTFFIQRFTVKTRFAIIIGLVVLANVAANVLTGPYEGIGWLIIGLYLLFALWSHVARPVGNFLVLCDRVARHTLRLPEKIASVAVTTAVVSGVALLIFGLWEPTGGARRTGMLLLMSSLPIAHAFQFQTNHARAVFGCIAAFILLGAVVAILAWAIPREPLTTFAAVISFLGIIAGVATTWICSLPFWQREL